MTTKKLNDWVFLTISALDARLPYRAASLPADAAKNTLKSSQSWLIKTSETKFSIILPGLVKILTSVNDLLSQTSSVKSPGSSTSDGESEKIYYESLTIILNTIEQCLLNRPKESTAGDDGVSCSSSSSRFDETLNLKLLLRVVGQFVVADVNSDIQYKVQLKTASCKVLYTVSLDFFNLIFSRISSKLEELSVNGEETSDFGDFELIRHIDLNVDRLIKLLTELIQKFKALKKAVHLTVINSLEVAIWNWIEAYHDEFNAIQQIPNDDLSKSCDALFDILDGLPDAKKNRCSVSSLQLLLLILSPKSAEEAINPDTSLQNNNRKKQFVDTLKRAINSLGSSKYNAEVVVWVKLCKAATYLNTANKPTSVIFTLMQPIFNDLATFMFNGNKPFSRGQAYIHQDTEIITDFFLSYIRLKQQDLIVLNFCCSLSTPLIYQHALICSLHRILMENKLEWWPKIDVFYDKSYVLRLMFTETLNKVVRSVAPHTPSSVIKTLTLRRDSSSRLKEKMEDMPNHKLLLLLTVRLMHADPALFLYNMQNKPPPSLAVKNCTQQLIEDLVSLVNHPMLTDVARETMAALLVLHKPDKVEMWNPKSPMSTFWDIGSQILFTISLKIIQREISNYSDVVKWLKEILIYRNQFLFAHTEYANGGAHMPIYKQAHIKLEIALLMCLWKSEIDTVSSVLTCFKLMYDETRIICGITDNEMIDKFMPNHSVYNKLADISTTLPTNETGALQEQIWAALRTLNYCVNGILPAWEITFRYWEESTEFITRLLKPKPDQFPLETCHRAFTRRRSSQHLLDYEQIKERIQEWAYMTGFLSTVGGVLLSCTTGSTITGKAFQHGLLTQFVNHLLNLLHYCVEEIGLIVKKHIEGMIGREMCQALYPILFNRIKDHVGMFLNSQGQAIVKPANTQFIEEIVNIVKLIFERKFEDSCENFGAFSIDEIIIIIVKYVRQLEMSTRTIMLKIKICDLMNWVIKRRDDLTFRNEVKFRNKMVDYLSDWIVNFSGSSLSSHSSSLLNRELDQSIMRALGPLLIGLPLQLQEIEEQDMNVAKSHLFLKYFTLCKQLLNDCIDASLNVEEQSPTEKCKQLNEINSLRCAIIEAITNLLSANIESGMVHLIAAARNSCESPKRQAILNCSSSVHTSPDMMLIRNVQIRLACMEVLTNILQQGAELIMFADSVMSDKYEQLIQIVTVISDKGELPIALALANTVSASQMDELVRLLVITFEAKYLLSPLLWNVFYQEVELSDCMKTLFRGNTVGCKIMTLCFKLYGQNYLKDILVPLIQPLLKTNNRNYEVDPTRSDPSEDINANRKALMDLTQTVFNAIVSSGNLLPYQLDCTCRCLYQVLNKRFPESSASNVNSVGTIIFLRCINPAIVSPQEFGIVDEPVPANIKRCLTLMSKILQNIANLVEFTKEPHMMVFNDFLRNNFEPAKRFFIQIASSDSNKTEDRTPPDSTSSFISDSSIQALHRLLYNNREKIGEYMCSSGRYSKAVGKRSFDKLSTLLAYLGPPEQPDICDRDMPYNNDADCASLTAKEYNDIKNLNIFYQFGVSKAGNPVFYYIARRFRYKALENDRLLMFVINTIQPYQQSPFEVFIDCSHMETQNRFMRCHLKNWMNIRGTMRKNLVLTYVFNCNTWMREYTKFHDSLLSPLKSCRNIIFLETLQKVSKYISTDQQKIPSAPALEEDVKVFPGAMKLSHKDAKVTLKVGPSVIQVTHTDKTKVLNRSVYLNDIYYAVEIDWILFIDEIQFALMASNELAPLSFIHADGEGLMQSILRIRNRWKISQPDSVIGQYKIWFKDIPGILLNMSLFNLISPNPNLRVAAYNQLCALTTRFNLKIDGILSDSSGLCAPFSNMIFIKSVSEKLAKNESHLTLQFLDECILNLRTSNAEMKYYYCLDYITPWLANLVKFCKSTDDEANKLKVVEIVDKLISLTIEEADSTYSIIRSTIWCSIGKIPDMIDIVIDGFLKRCAGIKIGSAVIDDLANTTIALASSNAQFVTRKIIEKLFSIFEQTYVSPEATLEEHQSWNDITVLSRFILMLLFNDCLDVVEHFPKLLCLVTFLANRGCLYMKASIYGVLTNVLYSLCTCTNPTFTDQTQKSLRIILAGFLSKTYYSLFGIEEIKSITADAFRYHLRSPVDSMMTVDKTPLNLTNISTDRPLDLQSPDKEETSTGLPSVELITDSILKITQVTMDEIPNCKWLTMWTTLTKDFAFRYNPALQPRALVVYSHICKNITNQDVKQLFRVLIKALDEPDLSLIEAVIIALTEFQSFLEPESRMYAYSFWIGISVLQSGNEHLFRTGLLLIERNLILMNFHGLFNHTPLHAYMMSARKPIEDWYFRTTDEKVGLSFKENFHFALVGHLIKGFRHSSTDVVEKTIQILKLLLSIIAKSYKQEKYQVSVESIAYLSALVSVSEDVRNRFRLNKSPQDLDIPDNSNQQAAMYGNHRTVERGRLHTILWKSFDDDFIPDSSLESVLRRSSSLTNLLIPTDKPKVSTLNKVSVLLDPEIITDPTIQVLTLTILSTLVKYATNEKEITILYQYLADGSESFSEIFCVVCPLLEVKLTNILQTRSERILLNCAQTIMKNTTIRGNTGHHHDHHLYYIHNCGFGGLWRVAGPFTKSTPAILDSKIFANYLEAIVETIILPTEQPDATDTTSNLL